MGPVVNGDGGSSGGGDRWGTVGLAAVEVPSFFSFRGPLRALQDLYEDWSAIYRNRIPPYLTLPLARPSQPSLYLSGHFAFPLIPPRPLSLYPFSLLLLCASLCAGFIQSFAALTPSFASFLVSLVFLCSFPSGFDILIIIRSLNCFEC